jgi:hypothetical protein
MFSERILGSEAPLIPLGFVCLSVLFYENSQTGFSCALLHIVIVIVAVRYVLILVTLGSKRGRDTRI